MATGSVVDCSLVPIEALSVFLAAFTWSWHVDLADREIELATASALESTALPSAVRFISGPQCRTSL